VVAAEVAAAAVMFACALVVVTAAAVHAPTAEAEAAVDLRVALRVITLGLDEITNLSPVDLSAVPPAHG